MGEMCRGDCVRSPRNHRIRFSYGIGNATNTLPEALALLQGLSLLQNQGIYRLNIIRDSIIIN
jgi:ribonuclease HI